MNDDGPPSKVSPYFRPFIDTLHAAGHSTHVVIPDSPLSWIGKAHAVGKSLTATPVCPDDFSAQDDRVPHSEENCLKHQWLLLNGAPASCTQVGLFHSGMAPSDFDLVVSGPNHGPNASTIYNLSSGTVGGALEGALCGKRSVALSFGSKDVQPSGLIKGACRRAVQLIENLERNWSEGVELYNINVPMVPDISDQAIYFTVPTKAYWTQGSLFKAIGHAEVKSRRVLQFRWAPDMPDMKRAAERSVEGEDLWASKNGFVR